MLKIEQLNFGKTDAKNEYAENPKYFMESFSLPSFSLEDYFSGSKYFIQGAKGTGKTAILNYIRYKKKHFAEFIYYKEEVDSEMKESFFDLLNLDFSDYNQEDIYDIDFENIWMLYLHIFLVEKIEDKHFFQRDSHWKKYKNKVEEVSKQSIISLDEITFIIKTKLTKGSSIEANSKLQFREKTRKIREMVKVLNKLYLNLNPHRKDTSFYLLIDEVELNKFNQKEYIKELILIRDLVIAINRMNLLSKEKGHAVKWIMAIRTEVLASVYTSGKEINKILTDFGNKISWHQTGSNPSENGLIKILIKKIKTSEKLKDINNEEIDDRDIFNKYFEERINGIDTPTYILQQTFFKPRDIVRLFNEIREKYGYKEEFTAEVFEGARQEYATSTWGEITESLSTVYTTKELHCIKILLSGNARGSFKLDKIKQDAERKANKFSDVKVFLESNKVEDFLENMYIVGVIGNKEKKNNSNNIRFHHRGQEHLLFDQNMLFHESIIKLFL